MFYYSGLFLLVIGVSMDGFGVGISYGMRKIRVSLIALTVIMLCSGLIVLAAMTVGNVLRSFLTPDTASLIGGLTLCTIGVFCFYNVLRSRKWNEPNEPLQKEMEHWESLKTVIKQPRTADLDNSGSISIKEALLLGFALALDAFGAGIGAAILGYSPFLTAFLIAIMSGLFIYCGLTLGMVLSNQSWNRRLIYLPPLLLVALGIYNMI